VLTENTEETSNACLDIYKSEGCFYASAKVDSIDQ